jgi:23S rRNA maturation-related 3'-5' exoribonuclease YhaM
MKSDILINEINLIQSKNIQAFTINILENAPDYFYRAMASSTGKYHPQCTCKVGGLVTHVKRATYFANRLCDGYGIKGIDRDIVLSAIILHDIAKVPSPKEDSKITYADYENHPINAEKYLVSKALLKQSNDPDDTFMEERFLKILHCIKHHMGLWTPASIKKDLKNYTQLELIVYTADYIAATKDLVTPKDGE